MEQEKAWGLFLKAKMYVGQKVMALHFSSPELKAYMNYKQSTGNCQRGGPQAL